MIIATIGDGCQQWSPEYSGRPTAWLKLMMAKCGNGTFIRFMIAVQRHPRAERHGDGAKGVEPPPPIPVESPRPDVSAPTGLADSGCLPESVLPEGDEQACRPGALDVRNGASPTGMSPRPSQGASEPVSPGGPVRPGRIRKRPRYLEDFVC